MKSGFSVRRACRSCEVSYGLVLQNASPDEDALEIYLTLKFFDANGRVVLTRYNNVGPIPAAATYYYAEYLDLSPNSTSPTRLVVKIDPRVASAKKSIGDLPPVANIRVTDSSGTAHVLGEFTNPYTQTISFDAYVTVVCFDASGNVIGGGTRDVQVSVPPGGRGGFDVTIYTLDASQIASAQASVQALFEFANS